MVGGGGVTNRCLSDWGDSREDHVTNIGAVDLVCFSPTQIQPLLTKLTTSLLISNSPISLPLTTKMGHKLPTLGKARRHT